MEDVLDVYQADYAPGHVLVCMDETHTQLLGDRHPPQPPAPGQRARFDSQYERRGTANLFLAFAPLAGWRTVQVTAQRTKTDWARFMRDLVDVHFPTAERITVVLDNLNTHARASLYETFPPAEAHRLARKLDLHFTPKHGSWLNMAEIEFSVLARQCLQRRFPDQSQLQTEVAAWVQDRNTHHATVHWRFTTVDARIRLRRLYPQL